MPRTLKVTCLFLLLASPLNAMGDNPPPGEPPQFWRATASRMENEPVIVLERPEYVAPRKAVFPEEMRWQKLRTATLDKTCRAFRPDGKAVDVETVLKRLTKPQGVVVFVRYAEDDFKTDPHPYYLSMLRRDIIVLVVDANAIFDLRP